MNDCDACNTGTQATEKCSAKGVAVCDPAYPNLPTTPVMKVIGLNGECLYNFEDAPNSAASALIVWDLATGQMSLTNDVDMDIPRAGDDTTPGTFDYIMVFDGTKWRKWRGPAATSGFIFWNNALGVWQFGQMNETGICTEAVLVDVLDTAWWPVIDVTVDPTVAGTKCIRRLTTGAPDLFYLDAEHKLQRVNPGAIPGFVVFEADNICDGSLIPKVKTLCEISTPPCETAPILTQFIGCSTDGKVASTPPTPVKHAKACGYAVMSAGNGALFENVQLGRTWYQGDQGSVRSGVASSGNVSNTILAAQIIAAIGYTPPGAISHVMFYLDVTLRSTTDVARRTLRIDLGGVVSARLSAYSWDLTATIPEDEQKVVSNILVPVNGTGDVAFDLVHSSASLSDYDYSIQVAGVFVCPTFTP